MTETLVAKHLRAHLDHIAQYAPRWAECLALKNLALGLAREAKNPKRFLALAGVTQTWPVETEKLLAELKGTK